MAFSLKNNFREDFATVIQLQGAKKTGGCPWPTTARKCGILEVGSMVSGFCNSRLWGKATLSGGNHLYSYPLEGSSHLIAYTP